MQSNVENGELFYFFTYILYRPEYFANSMWYSFEFPRFEHHPHTMPSFSRESYKRRTGVDSDRRHQGWGGGILGEGRRLGCRVGVGRKEGVTGHKSAARGQNAEGEGRERGRRTMGCPNHHSYNEHTRTYWEYETLYDNIAVVKIQYVKSQKFHRMKINHFRCVPREICKRLYVCVCVRFHHYVRVCLCVERVNLPFVLCCWFARGNELSLASSPL